MYFLKPKKDIPKFGDGVTWHGIIEKFQVYFACDQINDVKFECDAITYPKTVMMVEETHTASLDLYQIL